MSDTVRDYYNANAVQEHKRLDHAVCRIEFESTLRLIDKYFPKAGRVCDIGAATGRYTLELLRRGYSVTMLDLSEAELALAAQELQKSGFAAEQAIVGDARQLDMLPTASFDAALLMGPMYHIVEAAGRVQALAELRRVLKPQGVAIISFLNSWGVIQTGITDCPEWFGDMDRIRAMLSEQPLGRMMVSEFTECYFSTPVSAIAEVREAGLEIVSYAGTESFTNGLSMPLERVMLEQPEAYRNVVTLAVETCELPQYRDSTDHLHVVARVNQ
jgi:ubiquinone/menaquinone biosynthesis C-methylase UbiE